jgi:hypothetical protein
MMRIASRMTALALAVATQLTLAPNGSAAVSSSSISTWVKTKFPLQAAATQSSTRPATLRWALLIGLNDYAPPTADNIGARQDAESLRYSLLKLGWRTDHIILIKDRDGTAAHIIEGIRWLATKTTSLSTVVFHYSGHENWTRTLADGDNELKDVEIWATDNRYIIDGTVGREMNRIAAHHMWIDISTCRAAGFNDAGMIKPGRILTYSSPVTELSYEYPPLHHSAFSWFEINLGIYAKEADANHDGKVTVEEAFTFARPGVVSLTRNRQHPVMIDRVYGSMFLTIP